MCISEYSKTDCCYCPVLAYHSHIGISEYVVDMCQYETFFFFKNIKRYSGSFIYIFKFPFKLIVLVHLCHSG